MLTNAHVAHMKSAFDQDGWVPQRWAAVEPDAWGIKASNTEGRSIYYLRGNAYQIGYVLGTLATSEIEKMCTIYLQRVLPSFLSAELEDRMNDNSLEPSVRDIIEHMSNWLVQECLTMVEASWDMYKTYMPDFLLEIKGLRDGAVASGAKGVTFDRLLAVNTMPDLLMLKLNGGEAQASFLTYMRMRGYQKADATLQRLLQLSANSSQRHHTLDEALLQRNPIGCNSWGIKDPNGVVSMCRDFQLPNGGVYQDISCIIVRDSRTVGGCLCFYGGVPSIVGGTTGMKYDGNRYLAIGVNILRSRLQGGCGLPALGIIHSIASNPNIWTTEDAHNALVNLPRFAAWTYPVCSESNALALETGASISLSPSATVRYALNSVDSRLCSAVLSTSLPPNCFDGSQVENGVAVRSLLYEDPTWLSEVNDALFKAFRYEHVLPFSSKYIYNPADYNADVDLRRKGIPLNNNYFVPSRSNKDLIVTSNDSILPLMRLFQMSTGANDAADMTSKAVQWRYDRAIDFGSKLIGCKHPSRKSLEYVVSFLSPVHFMGAGQKQYWKSKDAGSPLEATIEGNLNVIRAGKKRTSDNSNRSELPECSFGHKAGTFANSFTWVSCINFI